MAKLKQEQYFSIDPRTLVEGRTLTFDLVIHLKLNERMITFKSSGSAIDDLAKIQAMVGKGLHEFQIRESDRPAYEAYLRGEGEPKVIPATQAPPPPEPVRVQAPIAAPVVAEEVEIAEAVVAAALPQPEFSIDDLSAAPIERVRQKPEPVAAPVPEAEPAPEPAPPGKEFVPEKAAEQVMAGLLSPGPESAQARDDAKKMVKTILRVAGASAGVTEILESPATEHATSVAIYSTLFAMGLKKTDSQLLQDIIIASLMHDIGFTQMNPEVLSTPRTKLTAAQKSTLESHVMHGLTLLQELDYVPNKRVINLMSQHHEKFNGSGYPNSVDSFRIDEIAQLISIADLMDTIVRGKYDGTTRPLSDALLVIAQIERTSSFPEYFNPDVFKKVMNWLKNGGGVDYLAAAEKAVLETKEKMLKTA